MAYTYISLFSSAGVGCYGFKMSGFECVATNELLDKRLNIQRINKKCKYDSGYINGDITNVETQNKIIREIEYWRKHEELKQVDVLIATPPCQGMSTANYKKGDEINRNSLVVEAIHLIKKIKPRIFIFENVRAFLTTMCIDKDDESIGIEECIKKNLSSDYIYFAKVVNFMDYGVPSSRPRTLVIGTLKSEKNFTPLNLFPLKQEHISLKEAIGNLKSLDFGEKDDNDLYHSFRIYPEYMRNWIHNLKEGETAFDNNDDNKPYKIVDGKKQILKSGHMGNKFARMYWDRPAPCITTRNDQLASQTTIHPADDRVLSIRELMIVMTIPKTFKWVDIENSATVSKNETLIRQSIGEAVPTGIMLQISQNIKQLLDYDKFIKDQFEDCYTENISSANPYILSYLHEKKISNVKETGSFYTPQIVVYYTLKNLNVNKNNVRILEPSVGVGSFIPQILRLLDDCSSVEFDLVDISQDALDLLKNIISIQNYSKKFVFNYINDDFLMHKFDRKYDIIVSNPPYFKMNSKTKEKYSHLGLTKSDNIYCLFLDKYRGLSDEILCVIPKNFIMIPDCNDIRRKYQENFFIKSIYDYGVNYFKTVFIEIISIHFCKVDDNDYKVHIENLRENLVRDVEQNYIYHDKMWLLYRDSWFDNYINRLKLDCFDFYRDRQLTNKYLSSNKNKIWVIRSRNLLENGEFKHINNYDRYVATLDGFILNKYYGKDQIVFTNFTYNTRAAILPKNCTINGSFCILLPKNGLEYDIDKIDISIYSSPDFRKYYSIVKNLSKFTLNVDSNVIYYIGQPKEEIYNE